MEGKKEKDVKFDPHSLLALVTSYWVPYALSTAVELRIAEQLVERHQTVKVLASESKSPEMNLFRLLRSLQSVGFFHQREDEAWENNANSLLLIPMRDAILHLVRQSAPAWGHLPHSVKHGEESWSRAYNGLNIWEYFGKNPEEAKIFDKTMSAMTSQWTPLIIKNYPWEKLDGKLIADVGGSMGVLLVSILREKCSHSRGIVFDRPSIKADAQSSITKDGFQDRIEFVGGSFFESVPKADVIIMKHVLHDWPDVKCVEILKECRKALSKESGKLLLIEFVLDSSPKPFSSFADLHMLVLCNGAERSEKQWSSLLKEGGFELEKTTLVAPDGIYVIEAK